MTSLLYLCAAHRIRYARWPVTRPGSHGALGWCFFSLSLWLVASNSDNSSGTLEMSQHEAGRIAITQADAARAEHARYVDEWMRTNWKPITSQYKMPNKTRVGEREREERIHLPLFLFQSSCCSQTFVPIRSRCWTSPVLCSALSLQFRINPHQQFKQKDNNFTPLLHRCPTPHGQVPPGLKGPVKAKSYAYTTEGMSTRVKTLCVFITPFRKDPAGKKKNGRVCVCVVGIVKSSQR